MSALLAIWLSVTSLPTAAAAPEDRWAEAQGAAARQDYAGATDAYLALLQEGVVDSDVYYNLGNVLYRQQAWAGAILAWRRAARLDPRDPDVEANLVFARRKLRDATDPPREAPWFAPWQEFLSPGEGQWLGMAIAGIGLAGLAIRRRWPAAAAPAAVAAAAGLICWIGGAADAQAPPGAVVLAAEARLTSDLSGGVDLFTLHAGAEVRRLDQAGDRALVGLPDGRRGWMDAAGLAAADPFAPFPADALPPRVTPAPPPR